MYYPLQDTPLVAKLAIALVLYVAASTLRAWYRLRHFPGPPLASISNFWLAWASISGRAKEIHEAARKKYSSGPLLRIAPDMLITSDPAVHRRINAARSGYTKAEWYNAMRLDPYVHSMFSTKDVGYHDDLKARTAAGYSGKDVPGLENQIDEQIENLKALIKREYLSPAHSTKIVDFSNVLQYFTLDSLGRIAYGKEFGYLATGCDFNGYIRLMEMATAVMALAADVEWIGKIMFSSLVLNLVGPKHTDTSGIGMLMGLAKQLVDTRLEADGPKSKDMLGSFLNHGLTPKQCETEILVQIAAGSDTTASVIRFVVIFVATTPHVYQRLQSEIDEAIARGDVSSPVTDAEGRALPYLQAVIYETMRYHPPAFSLLPKVTPPGGDTIDGKFVPGGTKIGINPWAMMRHTDTFGDDVDVFRPERWIEASAAKKTEMERVLEQIFGIGRYMCAGKTIAFMELNKVFVELFRDFHFQITNIQQPWKESSHTLFLVHELWMRITERT